jgi:hypothetical protein
MLRPAREVGEVSEHSIMLEAMAATSDSECAA